MVSPFYVLRNMHRRKSTSTRGPVQGVLLSNETGSRPSSSAGATTTAFDTNPSVRHILSSACGRFADARTVLEHPCHNLHEPDRSVHRLQPRVSWIGNACHALYDVERAYSHPSDMDEHGTLSIIEAHITQVLRFRYM